MKNKKITIHDTEIILFSDKQGDFISLTDIAKFKNSEKTGLVISHWLSTKYAIEFMGAWEKLHNIDFNVTEFSNIKNESGSNGFILSTKRWTESTNAIGIRSKSGRYGGTFAHKDIAFEFGSWISPEFKLYLIKEFQRLKDDESNRLKIGWDATRMLAKVNYRVHTDAVKKHLIPKNINSKYIVQTYASEADVLNVALFGMTAKQWQAKNSNLEGNMRDYAEVSQLVCLAGLESLNAEFIRQGLKQKNRLKRLNEIAIIQMKALVTNEKEFLPEPAKTIDENKLLEDSVVSKMETTAEDGK